MKKSIKYHSIMIFILIALLTITACSKKNADSESVFIFEQTESESRNNDVTSVLKKKLIQNKWRVFQPDYQFDSLNKDSAIEFLQDGTFSYHYYVGEYLEEENGTWNIEGTKLSMNTKKYTNGVFRHSELEEYRLCDYLTDEIFSQCNYPPASDNDYPVYKSLQNHNFDFKIDDSGAWNVTENYLYLHHTMINGLFISEKHLVEIEDPETNVLKNKLTAHPWYHKSTKSLNSNVMVNTVVQFFKDGSSSKEYISSDNTTDRIAGYWEIHGKYLYIHWDQAMNNLDILSYSEFLNDNIIVKGTEAIESIKKQYSGNYWYVSDEYLYMNNTNEILHK